jgi:hypothetical protein
MRGKEMEQIRKKALQWALTLILSLIMIPASAVSAADGIPTITSIYVTTYSQNVPATGNNGTTTTITITGDNLSGVTAVSFLKGTIPDSFVTSTNIVPSVSTPNTKFKVDVVTAAGASTGPRNVTVTTPAGTSVAFAGGFTVYRVSVSVSVNGAIEPGGAFDVLININNAANLNSYQFDLLFDRRAIQVNGEPNLTGVTDGLIHDLTLLDKPIQTTGWTFQPIPTLPSDQMRVIGQLGSANKSLTGSGYLAKINFSVIGTAGMSTMLTVSNLGLFNSNSSRIIPDTTTDGFITIGALFITNTSLPEAALGTAYTRGLAAMGGASPYTWSATGLPVGLNLNPSTGIISGTPSAGGDFAVNISVNDSRAPTPGSATKTLTLKVNPALQITTSSLAGGNVGMVYTQTLAAAGGKAPYAWSIQSGTLPSGMWIDTAGVISGTPTTAGGPTIITFYVSDLLGSAAVKDLSITITYMQPSITTSAATGIGITTATLNGILNTVGSAQNVGLFFEYWKGNDTATMVTAVPSSASSGNTPFSASLSNLLPSTTYSYHARGAVEGATVYGNDLTFSTTDPGMVNLSLQAATNTVSLNGTFNITIQAEAAQSPVDRVDAYINFDPAILEVVDNDPNQTGIQINPGAGLPTIVTNAVNNIIGLISYSAGKPGSPFPTGTFTVAIIQFHAKNTTSTGTDITFSTSSEGTTTMVKFGSSNTTGALVNATVQIITGAVFNISVVLQGGGRPDAGWVVPLTVKFFTPGADVLAAVPIYTFNLTTAKNGNTATAIPTAITPGTYDISATSEHTLCNVKRNVVINALSAEVNMGTLLEGDANGSHAINIQDFGLLAASYGKSRGLAGFDERADFNRNDNINITDFGLLAANYGKHCPVEIP